MKNLKLCFITLLSFFSLIPAYGEGTTTTSAPGALITFQIIQHQLNLTSADIASVVLIPPQQGRNQTNDYAVSLSLKADAARALGKLTRENLHHSINILLNDVLISSATLQGELGGNLMIAGLTQTQATACIQHTNLKAN